MQIQDLHCPISQQRPISEKISKLKSVNPTKPDPEVLIREFLRKQSAEFLVEQLMNQIQRNDLLFQSLYLQAELASGLLEGVTSFRSAIDRAARIDDFVSWREAGDFASGLYEVVNSLEELMSPSSVGDVVDLTEYFIVRLDTSLQSVDDSSGEVGEVLQRLENLHLKACLLAKPDPLELADRLFNYEMTLSFDSFYGSLDKYRDVLGENGCAHYRVLAEMSRRSATSLNCWMNRPCGNVVTMRLMGAFNAMVVRSKRTRPPNYL